MIRPSQLDVEREARSFSRRAFSGNRSSVHKKSNHIVMAAEAIRIRWNVSPRHWQVKHVRWLLEHKLADRASGTKYRYYCLIRQILIFQDHWADWKPHLKGPWTKP